MREQPYDSATENGTMWRFVEKMFLPGLRCRFVWCSGRSEERSPERNVHHCVCKAARSLWCDPIHTSLLIHKVNSCFPRKVVLTGHISSLQHTDTIYKLAVLSGFYFIPYLVSYLLECQFPRNPGRNWRKCEEQCRNLWWPCHEDY